MRPISHLATCLLLSSGTAYGFTDPEQPSTVLARGTPRTLLRTTHDAPDPVAWARFTDAASGRWQVFWDADKKTPLRIFGAGIAAPGSVADKSLAERFATAALRQHLDLLAPGTKASDFVLASNVERRGVRSVGFVQTQDGYNVDGGQISFRFKHDRMIAIGSEAYPRVALGSSDRTISPEDAARAALRWIAEDLGTVGVVESIGAPLIHAAILDDNTIVGALVHRVIVRTTTPVGRWAVDIEVGTARRFARRQTLLFFDGTVAYHVPTRRPGVDMTDRPAVRADVVINGATARTDDNGLVTWTATGAADLVVAAKGLRVAVSNASGEDATAPFTIDDGQTTVWDATADEEVDAQVITFMASHGVRDFMKTIAPNLRFLDEQLVAVVNIDDECNAFSDGTTINFFQSSNDCENTGRLPDVVHHEYGHAIHAHAVIPGVGSFDSALSEGASDYLAATMANDPAMGIGFYRTDEPLRHLDPDDREWRYPESQGESHVTGLIVGGAFWDLRKSMIEKHGAEIGQRLVDGWWYATLQRSSNILTAYLEVLAEDDDDGNLANGTPNVCEISSAFAAHGIALGYTPGPEIGAVSFTVADNTVLLPVAEGNALCPGAEYVGATLTYTTRGSNSEPLTVDMVPTPIGFGFTLPRIPEGNVLEYRIDVELGDGNTLGWPRNPAAPMYEVFIGEVRPLYCTDFENDPALEGWTHEMVESSSRRARDDWEWGFPMGISGDPPAAFSGGYVFGQDLGDDSNGRYQRDKREELRAPLIDVSSERIVRLQYRRWLTVQDGQADLAQIKVYGEPVWSNPATDDGTLHHVDYEWRFHDVDLSEKTIINGGRVDLTFSMTSDRFFSFGGWTIDDLCVVAWDGPTEVCGDGMVTGSEVCDDGNQLMGDGCELDCTATPAPVCGNGALEMNELCDDGNLVDGDGCDATCLVTVVDPAKMPTLLQDDGGCSCRAAPRSFGGLWMFVGLVLLTRWRHR